MEGFSFNNYEERLKKRFENDSSNNNNNNNIFNILGVVIVTSVLPMHPSIKLIETIIASYYKVSNTFIHSI